MRGDVFFFYQHRTSLTEMIWNSVNFNLYANCRSTRATSSSRKWGQGIGCITQAACVYICTSKELIANKYKCNAPRVLRARGGRFARRSPWICWHAARAAPLPFVQLVRDQNKQNPLVAERCMHLLVSQRPKWAKKSTGWHWKMHCDQKRSTQRLNLFPRRVRRSARDRLFIIYSTCMHTCRQGSAVNARVVYWETTSAVICDSRADSSRW